MVRSLAHYSPLHPGSCCRWRCCWPCASSVAIPGAHAALSACGTVARCHVVRTRGGSLRLACVVVLGAEALRDDILTPIIVVLPPAAERTLLLAEVRVGCLQTDAAHWTFDVAAQSFVATIGGPSGTAVTHIVIARIPVMCAITCASRVRCTA